MKKIYLFFVVVVSLSIFGCENDQQQNPSTNQPYYGKGSPFSKYVSDSSWNQLSLREKVGQTIAIRVDNIEFFDQYGGIKAFLHKYPIGGITVKNNHQGQTGLELAETIKKEIQELQEASKIPLFIFEDFEQGAGQYFDIYNHFPPACGMAATRDTALAYDYGRSIALEARSMGYNVLIHPCIDLNENKLNAVTNTRSLGDDPEKVIPLAKSQTMGIQSTGIAATAKHFPGDGVDFRDQHIVLTSNTLDEEEWHKRHGRVFREVIEEGTYCIMPGHISLPFYQKNDKKDDRFFPATLSPELLTDLLKGKMGFNGVLISDALKMAGFNSIYDTQVESVTAAFKAGNDVLLWAPLYMLDSLTQYVENGEVSEERINDAVGRIWALKRRLGLFDRNQYAIPYDTAYVDAAHQEITSKSITLMRDRDNLLPLGGNKKLLVISMFPNVTKRQILDNHGLYVSNKNHLAGKYLAQKLQNQFDEVDFIESEHFGFMPNADEYLSKYNLVIIMGGGTPHLPLGTLLPYHHEARTIWDVNSIPGNKLIFIGMGDPFLADMYFEKASTAIQCYSNSQTSIDAIYRGLTGELTMTGTFPFNSLSAIK